jgi:hypothetical protein
VAFVHAREEVWRTDGTEEGTYRVAQLHRSSANPGFVITAGHAYFRNPSADRSTEEIWASQGAPDDAQRVAMFDRPFGLSKDPK